jgi:hypothetical protein
MVEGGGINNIGSGFRFKGGRLMATGVRCKTNEGGIRLPYARTVGMISSVSTMRLLLKLVLFAFTMSDTVVPVVSPLRRNEERLRKNSISYLCHQRSHDRTAKETYQHSGGLTKLSRQGIEHAVAVPQKCHVKVSDRR